MCASKQDHLWSIAQNRRMFALRGALVTDHPTITPNLANLFGLISLNSRRNMFGALTNKKFVGTSIRNWF